MAGASTLTLKIIGDARGARKAIAETETGLDRMSRTSKKAAKGAAVALGGLAVAGWSAARAAADDEKAQTILARALKNTTGATDADIAAREKWIDKTARATGIADDSLRPALATLARATRDADKAQSSLTLAMDIATATGKPLESVSQALAKAHAGQTSSLGRLVPGLDKAILKSGDMNKISAELAKQVGGQTSDAANTAAGRLERLALRADELKESLGSKLLPYLEKGATGLEKMATFVEKNEKYIVPLAAVIGTLAIAVIGVNAALSLYTAITTVGTAATWLMNTALLANPLTWIVIAIIAAVAAFVLLWKKCDGFRNAIKAAGAWAADAFRGIIDWIKKAWNWFQTLWDKVGGFKGIISKAFKVTPLSLLINGVKKLISWLKKIKWPSAPAWVEKTGAFAAGLFADDHRPPGPGPGPAGIRYVNMPAPGSPGQLFAAGGSTHTMPGTNSAPTIVINVSGALDPIETAKQIDRILKRGRAATGGAY